MAQLAVHEGGGLRRQPGVERGRREPRLRPRGAPLVARLGDDLLFAVPERGATAAQPSRAASQAPPLAAGSAGGTLAHETSH